MTNFIGIGRLPQAELVDETLWMAKDLCAEVNDARERADITDAVAPFKVDT
jgi:hypothetical protein